MPLRLRARVAAAPAVLAFGMALGGSRAGAHELGTVRTTVDLKKDGTYRVAVFVDREHLPPGFAARAAIPPPRAIAGLSAGAEASAVGRILSETLAAAEVRFDRRRVDQAARAVWENPDPDEAEPVLSLTGTIPPGARVFTWRFARPLGSSLLTIRTEGEASAFRDWVEGGTESRPFALAAAIVPPTRAAVIRQYLALGYTHILPRGTDHILFVLGIFLLSRRWKPVLLQVTAFTLAHTITLGLTIYGVVALRPAIVEPLIALSIVYVAVENLFTSELTPWRLALVFGFGLVHGMGFAGVLAELGLPRAQFLPALLSFNLGVEAGQLTVIGAAYLVFGMPFGERTWYRRRVVVPASLAIAAVGLAWAVQRSVGLYQH
jgi:hypothetical protein